MNQSIVMDIKLVIQKLDCEKKMSMLNMESHMVLNPGTIWEYNHYNNMWIMSQNTLDKYLWISRVKEQILNSCYRHQEPSQE